MCQTKNDSFAAAEAGSTSVPVTNPMKNAVMAARGISCASGTNAGRGRAGLPRGRGRESPRRSIVTDSQYHINVEVPIVIGKKGTTVILRSAFSLIFSQKAYPVIVAAAAAQRGAAQMQLCAQLQSQLQEGAPLRIKSGRKSKKHEAPKIHKRGHRTHGLRQQLGYRTVIFPSLAARLMVCGALKLNARK
jgi:hypothetical protein